MITTTAMIRMGKVYNNLMVDLKPVNNKLILRSRRLIRLATGCDGETAERVFEESERHVKTAIVMILLDVDCGSARELLDRNEGRVGSALRTP